MHRRCNPRSTTSPRLARHVLRHRDGTFGNKCDRLSVGTDSMASGQRAPSLLDRLVSEQVHAQENAW